MTKNIRDLEAYSAYHGGSWRARSPSQDLGANHARNWKARGLNSECGRLKEILICRPPIFVKNRRPEKIQHLRKVNWPKLEGELSQLGRTLLRQGVDVRWMESNWFSNPGPNIMFVRDQFFCTPWGAIVGRMGSDVRAGEEKWAQLALAKAEIPILASVRGTGSFEGADALWAAPNKILLGVGNRTNKEGYLQIRDLLEEFGVKVVPIPLPKKVQHLLGLMQFVAPNRVLLRSQIVGREVSKILSQMEYEVIPVDESEEVLFRQGMNLLTLSPNRVIIPTLCANFRTLLEKEEIDVAAEVSISQLINAAGGIACATAPLVRALARS